MPAEAPNKLAQYRYTVMPGNEHTLVLEALQQRGWWAPADKAGDANFWWGGNKKYNWAYFPAKGSGQPRLVISQVENHSEICTKTRLADNLRKYSLDHPAALACIPETCILTSAGASGVVKGVELLKRSMKRLSSKQGKIWIVKPAAWNRGNGIVLLDSLVEVERHICKQRAGSQWVVQKYIEKPLLVGGRKFDIRSFVLVTPDRKVYMYRKSYVRTSSSPYNLSDLSDRSTHLTNDAVQCHADHYGTFEDSNKLSMEELQEALKGQVDIAGDIVPQMVACAKHAFKSVHECLNPQKKDFCFELFGLDFMIDDRNKVMLIEVNTNPALYRHGKLLTDFMPLLIEEVIQKAVDPLFPAPTDTPPIQPLHGFQPLLDAVAAPLSCAPLAAKMLTSRRKLALKQITISTEKKLSLLTL